jgi:hypothetical protein
MLDVNEPLRTEKKNALEFIQNGFKLATRGFYNNIEMLQK